MTQARANQIREILETALRLTPSEREAYLAQISGTDSSLRDEVLQRLRDQSDNVTKAIPTFTSRYVFAENQIVAGRFRILRFLGQGGMGEVYEAEDQELGAVVALKTIRPEIVEHRQALSRLRKETALSRKVTHPNVCRIFDFAREGDVAFITMELLTGETLADRLYRSKSIPVSEATPLVLQMIDGLAAAHRAGVIHRDFKPGNVYLVPERDGATRVVITDFGLARTVDSNQTVTEAGQVVGTLAYLSPEQLRGEDATVASDIYALGIVMFEMVTGHRPFEGAGISSVMKRMTEPPPSPKLWLQTLEPRWEAVLLRCLQTNPSMRFTSVLQVREWLGAAAAASDQQTVNAEISDFLVAPRLPSSSGARPILEAPKLPQRSWLIPMLALLLIALVAIGVLVWQRSQKSTTQPSSVTNKGTVTQLTLDSGFTNNVTFSGDGKLMAFSSDRSGDGNLDIWAEYQGGPPIRITKDKKIDQNDPALSPDGSSIAYHSEAEGGVLYINAALGGNERLLVRFGRNPRYSPDGKSIAYWTGEWGHFVLPSGKLYIVPSTGGAPVQLRPEFADARYPVWTEDGQHILFQGFLPGEGSPEDKTDWWVTDLDGKELIKTGAFDYLRKQDLRLYFSPPCWWKNSIVFSASKSNSTNIWLMPMSPTGYHATGEAEPVTFGAALEAAPWVLPDGKVAFTSANASLDIWGIALNPSTGAASGKPKQITFTSALDTRPSLSADGNMMAFARRNGDMRNVWVRNLETNAEINLTSSGEASPRISPDGKRVAYSVWENGKNPIYVIDAEGGAPRRVCDDCGNAVSWSPDGAKLLYLAGHPTSIFTLDVASGQKAPFLSDGVHDLDQAQISPDGRWVSFVVRLSPGQTQISTAAVHGGVAAKSSDWIVTVAGKGWNDKPRWSADSRTIYFYSTRDGFPCIWRQRMESGNGHPVGEPLSFLELHDPEFSLTEVSRGAFNLSVSRNLMVLNIATSKSNIWLTSLPQ